MKKNTTYNPQDMEDLLLNKSFEELSANEKEFALTQVDNETEYKEMRNTLISVKQIAAEQESVYVPNRIKEDLMQLMEKKKKPAGWFNFNSIGAFLFPSDKPLFKKPGLQLATLGLMLLLVVNVGIDFVNTPSQELAINTNKKTEKKDLKTEEVKVQEPKVISDISENKEVKNEVESVTLNRPKSPEMDIIRDEAGYFETEPEMLEEVIEKPIVKENLDDALEVQEPRAENVTVLKENRNKADLYEVAEVTTENEVAIAKDLKVEETTVTLSHSSGGDVNRVVSFNSVTIVSDKSKKKLVETKLKSQSLSDNSDVIDLLFVTL